MRSFREKPNASPEKYKFVNLPIFTKKCTGHRPDTRMGDMSRPYKRGSGDDEAFLKKVNEPRH